MLVSTTRQHSVALPVRAYMYAFADLSVLQSLERVVRLPREPGEKERVAAESITTSVCLNDKYRPARFPAHLRTIMAKSFGHPDPELNQE